MLVKNWMSKDVITVDVNDSMQDAGKLIKKHNIHGLPVMENGKLAGIVTDRDLKRASASDATALEIHELLYLISEIKVKNIMTKNPITIPLDNTIDEAAEILMDNKLSGAPVVDKEGQLVGIITQTDIFRVMVSLTGVREKGVQFGFLLEDRPGSIKEAADIIRKYGCHVVSILSNYDDKSNYRHVFIRACDGDWALLEQLKEELKEKTNMLYTVNHVNKKQEVYQDYVRPSGSWVVG
ncbi:MAG: CBS domain-containing protein [Desulfobacteraceae bacterium]|nr:MAG: CBS domain-containing protein [Desulfobacteraceae bacterium]